MATVLEVKNLQKNYGSHCALDGVSFKIEEGQVFGLLGPNGSGKTTCLGILLGALKAGEGQYTWFDNSFPKDFQKKLGSILEQPNFYPWLSGKDNLLITSAIRGANSLKISELLQYVGLGGDGNKKFSEYSYGMKQRLAMAATLIGDPKVLVLDEPANGVDAKGIADIREIIIKYSDEGKTVILASHILDEVEKVCSHVAILNNGKIIEQGSIAEVLGQSDYYEIRADNIENLQIRLQSCVGVRTVELAGERVKVTLEPGVDISAINRRLVESGLQISHLVKKNKSLESHFLELLYRSD